MAQKTAKPRKKANLKLEDPNIAVTIGPFEKPAYLLHKVIFDENGRQISCSFTHRPKDDSSDLPYAFNLTPGFAYKVIHTVRKDNRCEWSVIQRPYRNNADACEYENRSGVHNVTCYGPN